MQAPDVHHALRIFILVLVASLAMWRCAHVPADIEVPRVTLAGVALEDVTLFEQRYRITLRIHNPNAFGVAIDGVEYRVELNDREFARGVSVANITVPRFGTAVVNVQAVSTLADWLRQIAAGNGEQEDSLSYRIHGKLSLRDPPVKLPFVYHGEITLPAALLGPST